MSLKSDLFWWGKHYFINEKRFVCPQSKYMWVAVISNLSSLE